MHVHLPSYLAVGMFFPLPSAPAEPHLSLGNDEQDDSCKHISVRNESEALCSQLNQREKEGNKDGWAPGKTVGITWMCH